MPGASATARCLGLSRSKDCSSGKEASVVVDPAEERLQTEFAGVDRTYIPMHSVIRIDEVEKKGTSKIHAVDDKEGKIHQLPSPIYTPVKREP